MLHHYQASPMTTDAPCTTNGSDSAKNQRANDAKDNNKARVNAPAFKTTTVYLFLLNRGF
jgi:hypothetical protein